MTQDTANGPDEGFVEQVKDALEKLYDYPALHRHPLAQRFAQERNEPPGHPLRRDLIAAIESLNPGGTAMRSVPARLYNLLHMHYIGGMTLHEAANDLGISSRQAYRDLRRGQQGVAEMLWYKWGQSDRPQQAESEVGPLAALSSLEQEVQRLNRHITTVALDDLLVGALGAVEKLAAESNRHITVNMPPEAQPIATNSVIARQVLLHLLSYAVRTSSGPDIALDVDMQNTTPVLTLHYTTSHSEPLPPTIAHLITQLRWTFARDDSDATRLTLTLRPFERSVLIIDDNEGLVDLMKRYLSGAAYHVLSATNGTDGLQLATDSTPDVIIMDVMMPGMDGWEVLQRLRTQASTQAIPVIICSVIHDPELAASLGANAVIAKPVTKEAILNALDSVYQP